MQNLAAFHDYDIRGVYPTEINEDFYYNLGRAVAVYVGRGPIAVGHDMRLSSPSLTISLISGITDQGIDVVDLGMISTEMHYFASGRYGFEANVVISASHNPPQYNGVKIVTKGVVPLHGSYGLDKIKQLMKEATFSPVGKKGTISKQNIFDDWISHALSFVDSTKIKPLKVVVDAGNGMGGPSWQSISAHLSNVEFVLLYDKPDGTFPHHLADPLKDENTADLVGVIKEHRANLGLALDGDADRVFFFDEMGVKITGTLATAILARHFLQKQKGSVLYGAICGKVVPETIEQNGGKAIRTRVGHSYIKEQMKTTKALFAGEHSGHFYFADNYNADSSLIAGLLMLEILSTGNKPMSQIVAPLDKYVQSGEMNFTAEDIEEIIGEIETQHQSSAVKIDHLDGLSVWYNNYWFSVRASKTEPLLRLNIEADNTEILLKVQSDLIQRLIKLGAIPR